MKIKIVTLSTDTQHPGWLNFKASLDKFGYDYHLIEQQMPPGQTHVFGTQMPLVYKYVKSLHKTEYTHVIYCDAWDTVAMAGPEELEAKCYALEKLMSLRCNDPNGLSFFGSAEKACFPKPELASQYPHVLSPWKYVNGGGWMGSIDYFCYIYEKSPAVGVNDQLWLAERFLESKNGPDGWRYTLDYRCAIFQTTGFENTGDFGYAHNSEEGEYGRLINFRSDELPIFIHGNGRTNMDKIYDLCKMPHVKH